MSRFLAMLDKVRAEIQSKAAELRRVQAQKRSRDEVEAYVNKRVDGWDLDAGERSQFALMKCAAGRAPDFLTAHVVVPTPEGPLQIAIPMGPLFVQVFGADVVRRALLRDLSVIQAGVASDKRAETIDKLTTELEALGQKEEALIRDCEGAGAVVEYRPDADPRHALTWRAKKPAEADA